MAFAALNAQAGENSIYTGAGIGLTDIKLELDVGPDASHNINDETFGGQIFVGFNFRDMVSFEGGYIYFGENDSDNVRFYEDPPVGPPFNLELEVDGYYLNAQYHLQATEDTSVDFMLGAIRGEADATNSLCCGFIGLEPLTISEDETGFMAGVGLTVDMTQSLSLRVNANYYDLDFDDTIDAPIRVGVDLVWKFWSL